MQTAIRRVLAGTMLLGLSQLALAQNQLPVPLPAASTPSLAPTISAAPVAGDVVVSGFSGVRSPDPRQPLPAGKTAIDLTVIDKDGDSAKIVSLAGAGVYRDSRQVKFAPRFSVKAGQVGQIFGVAIGDQPQPTTYFASTSVFGLQISRRLPNGTFERLRRGAQGAQWAEGQFGLPMQGGPASIYALDGETGVVSLLTNLTLNGVPNPGPGLGNIAFDARNHQLFATDLYTGMIHRIGVDGADLGTFDHGVDARRAAHLPAVEFDPRVRMNIANAAFDVDDATTWGLAPEARRVWAVAVNQNRVYYSVQEGPQIWSVGLQPDGSFAQDARLEAQVPATPGPYAVSDIAFSPDGAMVLAQRAPQGNGFYDYSAFTKEAEPRVLRFWLKGPQDPPSPGLWKPEPEEYSVGFSGAFRNANGGVTFGYGFDARGEVNFNACSASIIVTGEKLRLNEALRNRLQPGGALPVDGLQIGFIDGIRKPNAIEPWPNSFWDYDGALQPDKSSGRLGSVRALEAPCAPQLAAASGQGGGGIGGGGAVTSPPYVDGPHTPPDPTCYGSQCTDCPPDLAGNNPCGPSGSIVDLRIKKSGATSPPPNVNAYTFTLAVDNLGPAFNPPPNTVVVSDTPPAGMSFSSITVTPVGWTCSSLSPGTNPFTCAWNGGPLPTGAIATISIVANALPSVPPPYPPFKNCASVSVDPSSGFQDVDPSNNQDCVTVKKPGGYDVAIKKSGVLQQGPALNGYSFTLVATNVGSAFTGAGAVTVTDVVPPGMTFTVTATTGAPNWNCGAPGTLAAGSTLNCNYIGTGPVGPGAAMGSITVTASGTGPGPFENCAAIGFTAASGLQDANPDDNKSCASVGTVDLAVKKTGVVESKLGQTPVAFTYTLTVTNETAPFNAPNGLVSVSDVAPAGVSFTNVTGSAGWTCAPTAVGPTQTTTCAFAGGPVAAGPGATIGTITITATYTGTAPVENCATVAVAPGSFQDQNPGNNKGCVTLTPPGTSTVVDVSLAKSFTPGSSPSAGVFTLKVHNEGGDIAAGTIIKISDQVPAGVTISGLGGSASNWNCGTLPVTGAATLNCTYTGTGSFAGGGNLPDLTLTSTLAAAGTEVGIYQNCATVSLANSSGPMTETSTANNTSCAVTNNINPGGCTPGSPNCPNPAAVCSQDVLIVVDNSVSIPNIGAVRSALTSFLQAMKDKGGKVDIHTFNNKANWGNVTSGWTPVTSGTVGSLNSQIGTIVTGGTRTNWDDALERTFNIVTAHNPKPLVIFITDGEPTAYNNSSGVEVDANNLPVTAAQEAVTWINQIRAAGSPVIALGFGPVSSSGYLDSAFGGTSTGPSNVNLETTSVIKMGSVYDLNGVMSTLANQMCGLLSLNKSVASPNRAHMIATNATSVAVSDVFSFTLTLTNNSSTPISGISVQDQVPVILTSVTAGAASSGTNTVAGNLVTWSGVTLGAHQSATAVFTGTLNKTYTAPAYETYVNYAQVTAATNYTATTMNNMNPTSGPVTEVDESSATFTENIWKQQPNPCDGVSPPASCFINVYKARKNPGAEDNTCTSSPTGGPTNPCPFTINVSLTNIPAGSTVTVSDQLTLGGSPGTWPGTVAPAFCNGAAPTSVSFSCTHNGTTSFSGDVTVQIPPGQSGQLKNCITVTVANTTTTPPFNVTATSCATIPLAQPSGLVSCPAGQQLIPGKGCGPDVRCASPFVFNAAVNACACPPGTVQRGHECITNVSTCRTPFVPNAAGQCVCPVGTVLRNGQCVGGPPTCQPPFVATAAGTCACPPGTVQRGRECVKQEVVCRPPLSANAAGQCVCSVGTVLRNGQCVGVPPICQAPFVATAAGACACPAGTVQRGRECVKQDVCRPPMKQSAAGGCECPAGTVVSNGRCVKEPPACKPPFVSNAAGSCVCPAGTVQRGGQCVAPIVCRAPMKPDARGTACVCPVGTVQRGGQCVDVAKPVCKPPARLNARGSCECPPEFVARGAACVPRQEQRPAITPNNVIRVLPGLIPNGRGNQPSLANPSGGQNGNGRK